ncbi:hypothetical protein CAEBREN_19586 [Caenorhabditis brenneri]|uniref:SPK domain-containing protein n=1 Tax=Caenorhabditis brenneri TaxID=135651 RepID=G0NIK9_CAEBE|nr:hypothetical protein CAEBREN_19586 [Caenorhabditis brenneri]
MPNQWTTAPEFTNFLNYIIEQTRNVEAPMIVQRMAREFKEKSGSTDTEKTFVLRLAIKILSFIISLFFRISRLRARIPTFAHIDTNTKVKLLFALN